MSEHSEAYRRRQDLRRLEEMRSAQSAKAAKWLASLESHPGYQTLTKDPEWIRITAEWQEATERDKQDRAAFKGRFFEELSDAEKARHHELAAALEKRLFPLKQAMLKLRTDYGIPLPPESEAKILAALKNTEVGKFLDKAGVPFDALRHLWQVRFPAIQFSWNALCEWLATLGISRYDAEQLDVDVVCEMLRTAKPGEGEGNGGAGLTPRQPAIASGATREAVLHQLKPSDKRAYYAYAYAEMSLGATD